MGKVIEELPVRGTRRQRQLTDGEIADAGQSDGADGEGKVKAAHWSSKDGGTVCTNAATVSDPL